MPVSLDPQSLRGLAHPLRVRILGHLRERGASTATRLAGDLGESSGTTSYHLRQLAGYGFVEEEPGRGAGRERWWRAAEPAGTHAADPADAEGFLRAAALADFQRVQDYLTVAAGLPPDWDGTATISHRVLRLTPDQAADLLCRVDALLADYPADQPGTPAPPGTGRMVFQWQALPQG